MAPVRAVCVYRLCRYMLGGCKVCPSWGCTALAKMKVPALQLQTVLAGGLGSVRRECHRPPMALPRFRLSVGALMHPPFSA
jgi:hypothetical protein